MQGSRVFRTLVLSAVWLAASLLLLNLLGESLQSAEIRCYQWITGKRPQHFTFDAEGIPMVAYEGNIGVKYNPVAVAEYAIKISGESDSVNIRSFTNCISWLIENQVKLNDSSMIYYTCFDWPRYGMKNPWRSAMSQGRAAQAYISAYGKSGDTAYLDYARKAINALFTPVSEGGVSYIEAEGYWFEEYADDSVPESRVLNGMCVVLQSLDDYASITGDKAAVSLFEKGISTLKNSLQYYDNGRNTCYDIQKSPASRWYHSFHISLMDDLYRRTGDPVFSEYRDRWKAFSTPSYLERLIAKPTRIGMFTALVILAAAGVILGLTAYLFSKKKNG